MRKTFATLILTLAACGQRDPGTTPVDQPPGTRPDGQTSFESAVPGDAANNADRTASGPESDAAAPGAGEAAAERQVEEADIVRKDGNSLYILNPYRGLLVVDITDPDNPVIGGRAPVFGNPVEMYVRSGVAYIVVSDYFSYWRMEDDSAGGFHGSQILVFDVHNPAAPIQLGDFRLEGFVSDTRIVGDVLYAVSNRYAWYSYFGSSDYESMTFVASINLADPRAPYEVDRVEFAGTSANVHPTSKLLYVAQPVDARNWNDQATRFTVLDISDAGGHIARHGSFDVEGALGFWNVSQKMARFQMDQFGDYFRVITHKGSNGTDGSQTLTVMDMTRPAQPTLVSTLSLPHTGGLWATRFDGSRVFLVTLVQVDPLEIIDLTDHAHPRLITSLEIPGLLRLVIPKGDRMLALATDSAWGGGVGMALFDVSNPARTRELDRVMFGSAGWAWSNATYDDKALRLVDDTLALVPFSGYFERTNADGTRSSQYANGLALVGIDLAAGNLTAHGIVETRGQVQRALPHQARLISFSDQVLNTIDHADLDHPRVTASLELARDVSDFAVAVSGGTSVGVQLIGQDWYSQTGARLRTVSLGDADGDRTHFDEKTLPVSYGRLWTRGPFAYVSGWEQSSNAGVLLVYEIGAGGALTARGKLVLPSDDYGWWWSDRGVALVDGAMAILTNRWEYFYAPARPYGYEYRIIRKLHSIDLRDPSHPALGGSIELPGSSSYSELTAHGTTVYTAHYEYSRTLADGRVIGSWWVDRVDLSDPATPRVLRKVNVPGILSDISGDGQLLYTVDYQYGTDGQVTNSLDVLWLRSDGVAVLQDSLAVPERIERARANGRAVYAATQRWWWDTRNSADGAWWNKSTLRTFDATTPTAVSEVRAIPLDGAFALRDMLGERLFLTLGGGGWGWYWGSYGYADGPSRGGIAESDSVGGGYWYGGGQGLLVYGVDSPLSPTFQGFFRTYSWVNQIAVSTDKAFLPSGLYGVQTVQLGSAL